MSLLPFETFLDDVMPELPGCTTAMALRYIRRTVNDFGMQTRYLSMWLPAMNVMANQAEYNIEPANGDFQLIRPEEVRFNGNELDPVTIDELNAEIPTWRTEVGEPRLYTREDTANIKLVYVPSTAVTTGLTVKVSYTPDFNASGFDSDFYNRFADGIAAGVKARLMAMPKKPWTDPQTAVAYDVTYQKEVMGAKLEADKRLSRARRRTKTYYR